MPADIAEDEAPESGMVKTFHQELCSWIRAGHDLNAAIATISPAHACICSGAPVLWSSCEGHDEYAIQVLVDARADLNLADERGIPPLSACCMYDGSPSCMSLLLDAKASVDQQHTNSRATPLLVAAHDGNVECIRRLLAAGADVHYQQVDGYSALHSSCQMGYHECVEVLLGHHADANLLSLQRFTPMLLASQNGDARCLEQVLEVSSAATRAMTTVHGADALTMACQHGHLRCMLMLLDGGCGPGRRESVKSSTMHIGAVGMVGHSALLYALLAHGVHPDAGGSKAMKQSLDAGHLECVQLLSSVAATRELSQNGHKWHAWEIARECGHPAIVQWLHASQGWNPLHHIEVMPCARAKRLLLAGVDLHAKRGKPHCTPLQRAADPSLSSLPQAQLLLQAAAPWSPHTHFMFPASARRTAVELLLIGIRMRDQLVAASATGAAAFAPDIWVQHILPLVVSRAQCRQEGCCVQITGLTGSPELNGRTGLLDAEASVAITAASRCAVRIAGLPKLLSVRWRNCVCRCARCLLCVENEVSPLHCSMCADDMLLHLHEKQREARCRKQGGQAGGPTQASDIPPVLLSGLLRQKC